MQDIVLHSSPGTSLGGVAMSKPKVNAALAYLATLHSETSRISMGSKLRTVARMVGAASVLECDWDSMRPEQILLIIRMLEKEGKAGSTVNNYLAALKGVAHASWLAHQMDHETLLRIQAIKQRRFKRLPSGRSLTYRESSALLNGMDCSTAKGARDYAIAAVFLGCGLRRAEAAEALIENYIAAEGALRIIGKGDKERMVYLPDQAVDAVQTWIKSFRGSEPGPLFCRIYRNGRCEPSLGLDPRSIGQIMKDRMLDAAHVSGNVNAEHFSTHDFRRTYATRLLAENVDITTVQKLMGHANVSTTARYDRRGEEEKKRVSKKVKL